MRPRLLLLATLAAVAWTRSATAAEPPIDAAEALVREATEAQSQGQLERMERSMEAACALYRARDALADDTLECERARVFMLFLTGQSKRALDAGRALAEQRDATLGAEHRHTLRAQSDVALYLRDVGDLEAALDLNRRTLEIRLRTLGERDPHTLDSYANLAQVLDDLGYAAEALPMNRKAYTLSREVIGETHSDTLISGVNLAINLHALGRLEEALGTVDSVYVLARQTLGDDDLTTIGALQALTVYMDELGRVEDALPLKEALVQRSRRVRGEGHRRTVTLMGNLAWSYATLKRFPEALDVVRKAHAAADKSLGPAHIETLRLRAREAHFLLESGDASAALARMEPLERDLAHRLGTHHPLHQDIAIRMWMARHAASPDAASVATLARLVEQRTESVARAEARRTLADAQVALGDDRAAIATLRALRDDIEAARERSTLPRTEQATSQARPARSYKRLARLEQKAGETFHAFASAEMAKGRTLLDGLALRRADRSGVLSAEETDRLAQFEVRSTLLDSAALRATSAEERAQLEAQRFELAREAAAFRASMRERHPKYAQLSRVAPVDLAARRKLPQGGVYISYLVADDRLLAWTLPREGPLLAYDLGPAAPILEDIDAWRMRLSQPPEAALWRSRDRSLRFALTAPEPDAQRAPGRRALERALSARLLAPLATTLAASRHWIISPDDALTALPFESLQLRGRTVVSRYEVRYAQTLALFGLIEERHASLAQAPPPRFVLSIGAARYSSDAPRTDADDPAPRRRSDDGGRALDAMGIVWPPLPAASREVDAVAATFPDAQTWKGADASERRLRQQNRIGALANFRYLHFATHGYLSPAAPLLSAIVLDQVDRDADIDGYVTATELLGYSFASRLAVLSACDTGRGALVQGEGVMGLPFALFIAGNADALVSLWPVYDDSTATFVGRFFARVARGEAHASALAAVKREFAADRATSDPVHWAGFVLYGTR